MTEEREVVGQGGEGQRNGKYDQGTSKIITIQQPLYQKRKDSGLRDPNHSFRVTVFLLYLVSHTWGM